MVRSPDIMSVRPADREDEADVIADILRAVRLETHVFGRFELGAPWAMRVPANEALSFYVMARGGAWLEPEASEGAPAPAAIALSAGDVALLPFGRAHTLRDPARRARQAVTVFEGMCPGPGSTQPARFGGDGPATAFVAGAYSFGSGARSVLLESLPPVLHLAAGDARTSAQLAATVQLILAESAAPGLGSTILSARLAEILLVHALRAHAATRDRDAHGLCALADPMIGAALRMIHARPAEAWTVERLARAVSMSRSGFAARFAELVGEPPLQYLTRWRMTEAAQLLRERDDSVPAIAERVGYGNPAAFMKAFARVQGVGPGAYRKAYRVSRLANRVSRIASAPR